MKHLNQFEWIRVIINDGRGMGHQTAAITLMKKLRELGFKGNFDIWINNDCDYSEKDKYGLSIINKLEKMIPSFGSELDKNGLKNVEDLGKLKISFFPQNFQKNLDFNLETHIDFTISAANDKSFENELKIFNTSNYISLQPTNWYGGFHDFGWNSPFILNKKGKVYLDQDSEASSENLEIDKDTKINLRLSVENIYKKPDLDSLKMGLSDNEKQILEITENKNVLTQLVYGLYPHLQFESTIKTSSLIKKLVKCLDETKKKLEIKKPIVLFLPNEIVTKEIFRIFFKKAFMMTMLSLQNNSNHDNDAFFNSLDFFKMFIKIIGCEFIDFLEGEKLASHDLKENKIYIVQTGPLSKKIFDYLMFEGTSFPPILEGCNAVEACEFNAKPYLHCANAYYPIIKYNVNNKKMQELHQRASEHLDREDAAYSSELTKYFIESLGKNTELSKYCSDRRLKFLEERKDIVKKVLDMLEIQYIDSKEKENNFVVSGVIEVREDRAKESFL